MNKNIFIENKFFKIFLFVCLLSSTACFKKKQSQSETLPIKETFRFNLPTEPPTLDWNKATDTTSSLILYNIMDGLSDEKFSNSGDVIGLTPVLAEKWTSSPDMRVWTFTIKKGVLWSDGKEFTVQHVVDGWERLLNPATASEYAYFLFVIKNARQYNKGTLKDFSKVGVSVNEAGQLVVELEQELSYFPALLSHPGTYPIRKDIIQKYGGQWTEAKNIVTLGAYRLSGWEHDKQLILKANQMYHRTKAQIKNILIHIIPEDVTSLNMFEQGKLDAVNPLPSTEIPILKKRKEHRSQSVLAMIYYGFNVEKKPFDDVRVRKAISMAINRKQITDLLDAGQIPLTSWIPKGLLAYAPSVGVSFDPIKAKQLLDSAGYKDRSTFPKFTILYNSNEGNKRISANIQAQIKKNLNISVELSSEEWKTYLQTLKTGQHDIFRMGWVADYADPDNFMSVMTSDSDQNRTYWKNLEFDSLVKKARSSQDDQERIQLYTKAQKILTEEGVPVIPLFSSKTHWLISPRVKTFPLNVMSQVRFKEVVFH